MSSIGHRWKSMSTGAKIGVAGLAGLLALVAGVYLMSGTADRLVSGSESSQFTYLTIFLLIAFDAVFPILPGETTLNAAATAAAHGSLNLLAIITVGALGAIVGDSMLFWLARTSAHKIEPQIARAMANKQVGQAMEIMNSSAPVLIVAGRYVPGMRFVVNATMGLSEMPYRKFLFWSVISGILWSAYTSLLAFEIGRALGGYPLASFLISGLVTTVAIVIVFFNIRRRRQRQL